MEIKRHDYDVLVIGAGGAGLRAAIAVAERGARTALVCKSLLGKAHTVMAEGGIAASLGNVESDDNWRVHFQDTMFGGKYLNNWHMAELHAKEAPDRVRELERWGGVFDRTPDRKMSQRAFGGHTYRRLVHIGDRTGLELIRTLQDKAVHAGIDVFMECTVTRLLKDGDRVCGAFGYWRATGEFVVFAAPAVVLATGGAGKCWRITSNSWECTGDGACARLRGGRGARRHGVRPVPPHRDGLAAGRHRAPRHRGGPRRGRHPAQRTGRAVHGALRPEAPRALDSRRRGARHLHGGQGGPRHPARRRPPRRLAPPRRDRQEQAARACTTSSWSSPASTSRKGRWRSARPATTSWAASASTPRPGATTVPGLFAAGRVLGRDERREPARRQLALRPARVRPAHRAMPPQGTPPRAPAPQIDDAQPAAAAGEMTRYLTGPGDEDPYRLHAELQELMHEDVGIFRDEAGLTAAVAGLEELKRRAADARSPVEHGRLQPRLAPLPRPPEHARRAPRRSRGPRCCDTRAAAPTAGSTFPTTTTTGPSTTSSSARTRTACGRAAGRSSRRRSSQR